MENAIRASSKIDRDKLEGVQARIGFARRTPDEQAPAFVTPTGYSNPWVSHEVTVRDVHPIVNELSLDNEGFVLVPHETSCANEHNPEIFKKKYLEEMVPFIKDYFKASWVLPTDLGGVTIRSLKENSFHRPEGGEGKRLVRSHVAGFAHCDYSPVAGPHIAARDTQLQGLEIRPYSRMMLIQTWRALSKPPHDFPLAFTDAATVSDADLLDTPYINYGASTRSWALHYNPSTRWYYYPQMTAKDLFVFVGYDSDTHYKPRSAHSAFDNRPNSPNANPRESVEARFYVYYE